MRITVIGTGYVGLVAGTCFADFGMKVCCIDHDQSKIDALNQGKIHLFEPGLEELVTKNIANGNITFSSDKKMIDTAELLIIAVGTPSNPDGSANLSYIHSAVTDIATYATTDKFIVIKSTVPIGTAQQIRKLFRNHRSDISFDVISNPEFLREGSAVYDFMTPDRIIIGYATDAAAEVAERLYKTLISKDIPIVFTNNQTAELIKYAANSYLATRIAFINEMADIAETVDADINEIARGMGLDNRIGKQYLHPSPGFGGSCFPKDIAALSTISRNNNVPSMLLESVIDANARRKANMAEKIIQALGGNTKGRKLAILGLTFKADTNDMRDSPSIDIITRLLEAGIEIHAYDPQGIDEAKKIFGESISYYSALYPTLENADGAVILTEWSEFRFMDLNQVHRLLKNPIIIDLRNIFTVEEMRESGLFKYVSIGRSTILPRGKEVINA